MKFVQWKPLNPLVVSTTDRSKAVVKMLFLFCVARSLHYGVLHVWWCPALCLCVSFVLLAFWPPCLGKKELVFLLIVHLFAMHTLVCVTFSLPPGVGDWQQLLLTALPGLFCLTFSSLPYLAYHFWCQSGAMENSEPHFGHLSGFNVDMLVKSILTLFSRFSGKLNFTEGILREVTGKEYIRTLGHRYKAWTCK